MAATKRDHAAVKKMLAGHDAASWLVGADYVEERGVVPYDDAAIRRRAELTLVIARQLTAANAGGERVREALPVGGGVTVHVSGGHVMLDVCLTFFGPAVVGSRDGAGGWLYTLDESRRTHTPVSIRCKMRRDLLARPDYLSRRAAELAADFLAPVSEHTRKTQHALGVRQ